MDTKDQDRIGKEGRKEKSNKLREGETVSIKRPTTAVRRHQKFMSVDSTLEQSVFTVTRHWACTHMHTHTLSCGDNLFWSHNVQMTGRC